MNFLTSKLGAVVATLVTSFIAINQCVSADRDPLLNAIEARQAGFKLYSFYAGSLFSMAKGDLEYDAAQAKSISENLKLITNLNNSSMWPPGSDNSIYTGKTRALPEIWSTYPKIVEMGQALSQATTELSAVAGNGLNSLRLKIGAVGKACKNCHDHFRAENF